MILPGIPAAALALAGRRIVDWFYPPSCMACGAAVADPHALCPACWRAMPLIERPFCERLGTPFAVDLGGPTLSPAAIADPPAFGRARAVARYEGPGRELVHRLKYGDRLDLAGPMGRWMARAGAEILVEGALLVPVPLHRWRLWRRRHNQAALLAQAVSDQTGHAWDPLLLRRVRRTRPQVGLSRPERAENLQGALRVDPARAPALAGRAVVLVDDVLTTGATADAAAGALLRAGAASVDVLTFARVCLAP